MTSVLLSITLANINQFSFFFTFEFGNKFAIKCLLHFPPHFKYVATQPCEMTLVIDIFILKLHSTSVLTNRMLVYDEVQMQVTKTVQNVPLLHRHRHEVVNATGRSRRQ